MSSTGGNAQDQGEQQEPVPATALPLPLPGEGLLQGSQIIHDVNPETGAARGATQSGLLKRAWPRWAAPELPGLACVILRLDAQHEGALGTDGQVVLVERLIGGQGRDPGRGPDRGPGQNSMRAASMMLRVAP